MKGPLVQGKKKKTGKKEKPMARFLQKIGSEGEKSESISTNGKREDRQSRLGPGTAARKKKGGQSPGDEGGMAYGITLDPGSRIRPEIG